MVVHACPKTFLVNMRVHDGDVHAFWGMNRQRTGGEHEGTCPYENNV